MIKLEESMEDENNFVSNYEQLLNEQEYFEDESQEALHQIYNINEESCKENQIDIKQDPEQFQVVKVKKEHIENNITEQLQINLSYVKEESVSNELPASEQEIKIEKEQCKFCNKMFEKSYYKNVHQFIHTKGRHFQTDNVPGEKRYACTICPGTFTSLSSLKKHERIHSGEKPYKCNYCLGAFTDYSTLKRHERIHTGEKPYTCKYCAKAFADLSALRRHERIHTGERPYKCHYCENAFADLSALRRHEKIHTGERPYKCRFCSNAYPDLSTLKRHERITHTGEKPDKCNLCDKSFVDKTSLKKHEKTHIHKCPLCQKEFLSWSLLRRHNRIHNDIVVNS